MEAIIDFFIPQLGERPATKSSIDQAIFGPESIPPSLNANVLNATMPRSESPHLSSPIQARALSGRSLIVRHLGNLLP